MYEYETVSQTTYTVYGSYPNHPVIQSKPVPDLSYTYGPVPDPSANYEPYPPQNYYQPYYYPDPNVTYGPPVVQPSGSEAFGPANYGTSINNNSFRQFPLKSKKKLKKPKIVTTNGSVSQSVPCKLCKIECGSVTEYEKHVTGKKHNKCLMKMYSSTMASVGQSSTEMNVLGGQGLPRVWSVPADLEAKKQKLFEGGTTVQFMRVCALCNIACNGDKAISDHLIGKKHIAQERALNAKANPSNISASNISASNSQNSTEKITVVGPGYCEVCKISCTSNESLVIHRQGKRHRKNLENLRKLISDITQPSLSSVPVGPVNMPTAVVDNPAPILGPMPECEQVKKKGARSVEPADLETKKRRVLECGADAGAVRTCNVCNVVCNGETVFNTHLSGQKHATLVKRAAVGVAPNNQYGL